MRNSLEDDSYWDYLQNNPEKKKEAGDNLYAGYQNLINEGKMTQEMLDGMTEREEELLGEERVQNLQISFDAKVLEESMSEYITESEKMDLTKSSQRVEELLESVHNNPTEENKEAFEVAMQEKIQTIDNLKINIASRTEETVQDKKMNKEAEGKLADNLSDFDALIAEGGLKPTPPKLASQEKPKEKEAPEEIAAVVEQNSEAMQIAANTLKDTQDMGEQEVTPNNAGTPSASVGRAMS